LHWPEQPASSDKESDDESEEDWDPSLDGVGNIDFEEHENDEASGAESATRAVLGNMRDFGPINN